jgi:hypothetical protein
MNPEPEKKAEPEKKSRGLYNGVVANLSDSHCQNCSKALVCKFSEKAVEYKNKVSGLIPEEMKGFLSFQFQCRYYSASPQPGVR